MHWLPSLFIFLVVFFCYIHVIRQKFVSRDTNLLEIGLMDRSSIDDIMHYRVPVKSSMESIGLTTPSILLDLESVDFSRSSVLKFDASGQTVNDVSSNCIAQSFMLSPSNEGKTGDFVREINSYFSPYSCVNSSYEILATDKSGMTTRVITFTGSREIVFCLKGEVVVKMAIPDSDVVMAGLARDQRTSASYSDPPLTNPISVNLSQNGLAMIPCQWSHTIDMMPNSIILIARYRCFTNIIANCNEISEDLWRKYKPKSF